MCYDISDRATFDSLLNWDREIKRNAPGNVCKMWLGTKCDLESKREVMP